MEMVSVYWFITADYKLNKVKNVVECARKCLIFVYDAKLHSKYS